MALLRRDYLAYNREFVPRPTGFINAGTTCWWNSLLQCFLSCSALNEYLSMNRSKFSGNKFAMEYIRLVDDTTKGAAALRPGGGATGFEPRSLQVLSGYLSEIMSQKSKCKKAPDGQESVQEFIVDFIDLLNDAKVDELFHTRYAYINRCGGCGAESQAQKDERNVFVELSRDTPPFTLRSEFCNYIGAHGELVDEYRCEKCRHVTKDMVRVQKLRMLREVVIVYNKWKSRKWYPQHLQFTGRSVPNLVYRLIATIDHVGVVTQYGNGSFISSRGGHYYSWGMRDQMYRFDDTSVYPGQPVFSENTIVLFYHLVSSEALPTDEQAKP